MNPPRRTSAGLAPNSAYGRFIATATAWFERRPLLADTLFASLLAALAVAGLVSATPSGSKQEADLAGLALAATSHLALALRRRRPVAVLALVAVTTWMFWVNDYATNFDAAMLIAIYSVMANEPNRRKAWTAAGALIGLSATVILSGIISDVEDIGFGSLAAIVTVLSVATAIGDSMWNRRAYLAEVEARAELAESERRRDAQRAVVDERTRIARELHDVVAHSMSVMVVQAGAARRMLAIDPDRAADALRTIETTGRESMHEMRRIVGVLRSDDQHSLEPQPDLRDIDDLVARCREAGMDIELRRNGTIDVVPAGLSLTAYRIVQEALTNVFKHAGPASAVVAISADDHILALEIVDDGRGASTALDERDAGHGLVGMRERIVLYGGTLTVGPRRDGGFAVTAELPLSSTAPSTADAESTV
ncbi:MAG: sensor histidine kinase [Acidimicrobiales bacterium]